MAVVFRSVSRLRLIVIMLAMCSGGVLPAKTPCRGATLPKALCVVEARSAHGMAATGSPEATRAAVEILEKGGNAIDAAVAAAYMLGVVDAQSSGLGGVTYLLIRLANGRATAIDGMARAPAAIDIEKFRQFKESGRTYGYETIAVPTTLASLEHARIRYGTMDLATLLQPAIETAEKGYPLSEIQIIKIQKYFADIMNSSAYVRSLILKDGRSVGKAGDRRYQPDLANTYRRLAAKGARIFYFGKIANEIEADMIGGGSFLRKSDLSKVNTRELQPLRTTYRGFDVISYPPPGGGAGVVSILNLLEVFPSEFLARDTPERHHLLLEAFRIGAADARLAVAGERIGGLSVLNKRHARRRAALIVPGKPVPEELYSTPIDPECARSGDNTTHISVADSRGNVVSMTQTLSRSFGAKVATPGLGFPYNNFLALFNTDASRCPGFLHPNMSLTTDMAPTIVLKDGKLFAALGSPGSNKIPPLVSEVISNMVDRNMDVREAVTAPRVLWGGSDHIGASIEVFGPISKPDVKALERMGFDDITALRYPPSGETKPNDFGGINAVAFDPETGIFTGVGDPRRFGSAMGPRKISNVE